MISLSRSAAVLANLGITLVGLGSIAIAPAFAENASVSGSVSYTTPAGFTTSISAEKVAPTGYTFDAALTVTAIPGGTAGAPSGLSLNSGAATATAAAPSSATLKDAVITKLNGITTTDQSGLDAYATILKAAAGANGLE
jgi:hypothetical protein